MSTTARCDDCKYSIVNTNNGYCPFYLANNHEVCKDNEHFEWHNPVPKSTESCECMYPDVETIPEGICGRCGLNRPDGPCGYVPKVKEIVPVIGSRFYTLSQEEGMIEPEPIVFDMGE